MGCPKCGKWMSKKIFYPRYVPVMPVRESFGSIPVGASVGTVSAPMNSVRLCAGCRYKHIERED